MRRPRRTFTETTQNQDRWLLTYADMITLLAAFFLMLYSMSVMSKGKFSQLAQSVRKSFSGSATGGGKLIPESGTAVNQLGLSTHEYRNYTRAMQNLRQYVEQNSLTASVSMTSDERGVVISLIADNMLFDRGKADVQPASLPVLERVADVLKTNNNQVTIEGHTCDLPIQTPQFPSNWELSSARAGSLLRYFTGEQALPAGRFIAAGYADTKPRVSNTTAANRARNRRVDIVIMKTEAQREVDLAMRSELRRITVNGVAVTSLDQAPADGRTADSTADHGVTETATGGENTGRQAEPQSGP